VWVRIRFRFKAIGGNTEREGVVHERKRKGPKKQHWESRNRHQDRKHRSIDAGSRISMSLIHCSLGQPWNAAACPLQTQGSLTAWSGETEELGCQITTASY
jgi:hypothetical protein